MFSPSWNVNPRKREGKKARAEARAKFCLQLEQQTQCQLNGSRISRQEPANIVELRVGDEKETRGHAKAHSRAERRNRHSGELRMIEKIVSVAANFDLGAVTVLESLHNCQIDIARIVQRNGRACKRECSGSTGNELRVRILREECDGPSRVV